MLSPVGVGVFFESRRIPMSATFVCKACDRVHDRNYRLGSKEQQYCRDRSCQRQRRREYQRKKLRSPPAYDQKPKNGRHQWRPDKGSLAEYQRAYRQTHPEYTARNRQQQHQRNAKRRPNVIAPGNSLPAPERVIVKMNSCTSVNPGAYHVVLKPGETLELIVKMNSCSLDFSKRSAGCSRLAIAPGV